MSLLLNSPKVDPRDVRPGVKLINVLSNGSQVLVRVVEFIESVQMWRVTDAREILPDIQLISYNRTWACPIENLHYIPGPDFCCGPAEVVKEWSDAREANARMADNCTLVQADNNPSPMVQYVMGMLSTAQECLELGNVKLANEIINDAKLVLDKRVATKDEHGRHDYAPGEQNRRTRAKLNHLASQRESKG